MVPLIHLMGMNALEEAAMKPTWKTVWTAGQSVGLIEEILSVKEIYQKLINEYDEAVKNVSKFGVE
jgi:nitronate monooxygenase